MEKKALCAALGLLLLLTGCRKEQTVVPSVDPGTLALRSGLLEPVSVEESTCDETTDMTMLSIPTETGGASRPLDEEIIWYTVYTGEGFSVQAANVWVEDNWQSGQSLAFRPVLNGDISLSLELDEVCINGVPVEGVLDITPSLTWYDLTSGMEAEIKTVPVGRILAITGDNGAASVSFVIAGKTVEEDIPVDFTFPEEGQTPRRYVHQVAGEQLLMDEDGYRVTLLSCGFDMDEQLCGTVRFENNTEEKRIAAITGIRLNGTYWDNFDDLETYEITFSQYELGPGNTVVQQFSIVDSLRDETVNLDSFYSGGGASLDLMILTDLSENTGAYQTLSGGSWYPVTLSAQADSEGTGLEEPENEGILIFEDQDIRIWCIDWEINNMGYYCWRMRVENDRAEAVHIRTTDGYADDEYVNLYAYEDVGPACTLEYEMSFNPVTELDCALMDISRENPVMMPMLEIPLEITGAGGGTLLHSADETVCIPALELPYEVLVNTEEATVLLAEYGLDDTGSLSCRLLIENKWEETIVTEVTDVWLDGVQCEKKVCESRVRPDELEYLMLVPYGAETESHSLPQLQFTLQISAESGELLYALDVPVEPDSGE